MSVIDCVVHDPADRVVDTESASLFIRRNVGLTNFLLLVNGEETLILTSDVAPWSYHQAERLARHKGYARFVCIARDGTTSEGVLTGRNAFQPVARRQLLSVVA